jgi:hypothetical protein
MIRIRVQNTETGCDDIYFSEEMWEIFKADSNLKFLERVRFKKDKQEPIAKTDIYQMNKKALVAHCQDLGIEATEKITVKKLQEMILDHRNTKEENLTEI